MIDSASRNNYYTQENKPKVQLSQVKTEPKVQNFIMAKETSPFFQRLARVLGTSSPPDIAKIFKITPQSVYKWQKGKSLPGKGKLEVIAGRTKSLGLTLDWILYGDEYKLAEVQDSIQESTESDEADRLLKENSFPDVVRRFLKRFEQMEVRLTEVESELAELKSKGNDNDSPQDPARVNTGGANTRLAIAPPKPMSNISHTNDIIVLIDRIQNEDPDITEVDILEAREGRFENLNQKQIEIIQRNFNYYTPLEVFGDNESTNKSALK